MKMIIEDYKANVYASTNKQNADFIIEVWRFFSEISSVKFEDSGIYLVLNAMFSALRTIYAEDSQEFNGIIYPSAGTEGKGLNIVLTPDAVETYLELEDVIMQRVERVDNVPYTLNSYPITEITSVKQRTYNIMGIGDFYRF